MSRGRPLVRLWMDFMVEVDWIEAMRLFIQAIYDKPRTSFNNGL